jgi:hypothetical protein
MGATASSGCAPHCIQDPDADAFTPLMCFAPEADLVAGVVTTAIAADAMRHVRQPSDNLLVAIPAVLAVHEFVECFVWWGLEGEVAPSTLRAAVWTYLLIAFVVVPVLVPLAVAAVEPAWNRRRVAVPLATGIGVAAVLFVSLVTGAPSAHVDGHHLSYSVDQPDGGLIVVVYVFATCSALLLSQARYVRWFGVANLVAVATLAVVERGGLVSLWCTWAAVTSIAIAVHLRARARELDGVSSGDREVGRTGHGAHTGRRVL